MSKVLVFLLWALLCHTPSASCLATRRDPLSMLTEKRNCYHNLLFLFLLFIVFVFVF